MAILHAVPAWPAKWEVLPSVAIEETWSDNVELAPPGSERSEWITTLTPRLSIHGTGDRIRADIDYSPQLLVWANERHSRVLHLYSANGTAEFVKRVLFLEARSAASQQIVSLLGPQPESNVNQTPNRTTVRTNSVSPYLRQDFGSFARGEARVTYSTVESDAATDLANSRATNVNVKLDSGPANRILTWNVAYSKEHVDYQDRQFANVDIQKFTASARRMVSNQLALLATAGYDDIDYITTGPTPRGFLWSAGAEWTPTPRTRLVATAGRRYFGSTALVEFSHRTRLTVWNLGYTQDISTTSSEFLIPATVDTAGYLNTLFTTSIPDPAARLAAVNTFIARNGLASSFDSPVNFFSSVPFLTKRLQGSFGTHGVRNTILVNLFTETREALAANQPGQGDFAEGDKVRQTGGDVAWTHTFSPLASGTLSCGVTRSEFIETARTEDRKFLRASITRQLLPRVTGSLAYRRLQNSSSSSGGDYSENAVIATLTARF